MSKFKIGYSLAITSILGFSAIVSQVLFNYTIDQWINGFLFLIIGAGITLIGSIWSAVNWKDGIDTKELGYILFTVTGILSMIVGLIELPISFLDNIFYAPGFQGVKAVVAMFAIILIFLETFLVKRD